MTISLFNQIVEENNIPSDAEMMSDSGWECDATKMNGIYYNKNKNTLVFTQEHNEYTYYAEHADEWKLLYTKN